MSLYKNARSLQIGVANIKARNSGFYDGFGRLHDYLRISVVDKCNFRCQYCYPKHINYKNTLKQDLLNAKEIAKVIDLFTAFGKLKKVRITGGEPLIRSDVVDIIRNISHRNIKIIGLTTNGYFLDQKIAHLKHAGLTNLNVSLDTLNPLKFSKITGEKMRDSNTSSLRFYKVFNTIQRCVEDKEFPVIKINCVVMKTFNMDEICQFVELTKNHDICVRFIEYMPFLANGWDTDKYVPYQEILKIIRDNYDDGLNQITTSPGETAKLYRVNGYAGTFGFISTMSQNFCGTCNRLRLTANGTLKNCIFGNAGLDLKTLIRSPQPVEDVEIVAKIKDFMLTKKKHHTEGIGKGDAGAKSLPMVQIGG